MVTFKRKGRSFFGKLSGIERNVDEYLTDNFSSLLKTYNIARKSDLNDTMIQIEKNEESVEDLVKWKDKTRPRVTTLEERIKRLETKYGVK